MSLGISWDLFWDRAYRDAPLLDPAVANHIDKLFFPGQSDHVDISSSSSLPYAQELAELFSDENSKRSLSREDVYSGFRALATSNIRNSQSKQQLGNLHFRLFLYRVFDVQSAIDRGGANPTIARVVASDLDLLDRQTGSTPQAKIDEAGSGGTPLASSDELQPLLRTMTTTPKTVSDFRGECLLQWDEDTKVLIQHCFWDLFDFVGGPAAASFTRAHLADLASDATSERCSDAQVFISRYDTFLQTFGDGSVARAQVHAILDAVANQVCLSCEGFRIALNAYTMRKIRTAQKVMASMKLLNPGTKLVCRIPDCPRYMRCRYVRRTDKGLFVVAYKGQELTVDYVEERSSDDESLEADAEAAQAAAAIQCDMSSFNNNNNNMNELGDGSAAAAVPYVDPWAHIDWSDEAYARDAPFVLRAIAADFPGFQLGGKIPASEFTPHTRFWPIDFFHKDRHREVKHRIDLDLIDYGISFEPFCTAEFLPSLSPEDHKRLMDTAAMRESFRCFFLHLAVELGVHPVALQHVCRERCGILSQIISQRTAADEVSDCQFFSEAVDSVLRRQSGRNSQGAWENNFVDAQFLQAAWPQELDNVRLLIVFCDHEGSIYTHDWNLFTPIANAQSSFDTGRDWTGRDVILKLQNGHFTILRHRHAANPIQEMLNMMSDPEVRLDLPGERQLLHLESILGGEPDPTRPKSVAQLYAEVMQAELSRPPDDITVLLQRRPSISDDMMGLD